ncbi:hypothetical protein D3C87_1498880 [compost metagenome]
MGHHYDFLVPKGPFAQGQNHIIGVSPHHDGIYVFHEIGVPKVFTFSFNDIQPLQAICFGCDKAIKAHCYVHVNFWFHVISRSFLKPIGKSAGV